MNSVHVTFIEGKHWKTLDSLGKGSFGEVFLAKKKYVQFHYTTVGSHRKFCVLCEEGKGSSWVQPQGLICNFA